MRSVIWLIVRPDLQHEHVSTCTRVLFTTEYASWALAADRTVSIVNRKNRLICHCFRVPIAIWHHHKQFVPGQTSDTFRIAPVAKRLTPPLQQLRLEVSGKIANTFPTTLPTTCINVLWSAWHCVKLYCQVCFPTVLIRPMQSRSWMKRQQQLPTWLPSEVTCRS